MLSIAAAWGLLVLVWQQGHGSDAIWGIQATGSIPSWMPPMVFAFLFGLSMDYEVFILARMREEFDRTGLHQHGRRARPGAAPAGWSRAPRLILFLAFVSTASSPGTDLKISPPGWAQASCSTPPVIRALIVPAVIALMGRWNWQLPHWPARQLRVAPSPLRPRAALGEAE